MPSRLTTSLFPARGTARYRVTGVLLVLAALVSAPLAAQPQSVNPGINSHYQDARFERWLGVFERRGREVYDRRHDILAELPLQPGMSIADIGAGTGLFTLLFAESVGPAGTVYAVDIAEDFVSNVLRRADEGGYENVVGIVNSQKDTLLPPGSVDVAFVCDTYHHFEYPKAMLESIHRALRPGGSLVVVDFRKHETVNSDWVMSHVRADEASVVREIEASGFRLTSRPEILRGNYFMRFATTDDARPARR